MTANGAKRLKACAAVAAVAAVLVLVGCAGGFEGTVRCNSAAAEVVYDPGDGVRVRLADGVVGWGDADGRGVDDEACETVRTQTEWFVGIPHEATEKPLTLRCRFAGDFFVHVHPVYTAEGGEDFPSGSALYVVVDRKTLVVSASVERNAREGSISFSPRYCSPARK